MALICNGQVKVNKVSKISASADGGHRYYGHFLCIFRSKLMRFGLWIPEGLGLGFHLKVLIYTHIIIWNGAHNHFPPRLGSL